MLWSRKGPMDNCGILPPGMDVKQTNASTPSSSCIGTTHSFLERDRRLL
jgi:hypothetical protein